jgi:GNAT superfamily N-acetyltransferase
MEVIMNTKAIIKYLFGFVLLNTITAYGMMDDIVIPGLSMFDDFDRTSESYRLSKPTPHETTHSFINKDGKEYGSVWYRNANHDDVRVRHIDGFNIYSPKDRGNGDGTKRLDEAIDLAERDGIERLTLWANPAAYTLYRRAGFEDYSVSYCANNAVEYLPMKKDLKPYGQTFLGKFAASVSSGFKGLKSLLTSENHVGPAHHTTLTQDLIGNNNKKYGYISYNDFYLNDSKTRYINYLEVNPQDRRQGHGSQFLKEFMHQSEIDGINVLNALVKKEAYNLYSRAGFIPKENVRNGATLIAMEKKLDPDQFDIGKIFSA